MDGTAGTNQSAEGGRRKTTSRRIPIKRILLPAEHGSWGMLFEPVAAGLAIAPGYSTVLISAVVVCAFLTRQPMKVFIAGIKRRSDSRMIRRPVPFLAAFLVAAAISAFAVYTQTGPAALIPLAVLIPAGLLQVVSDAQGRSRDLLPEIVGSVAISSSAPAIALAAGWPAANALALWLVFVCRSIPSIVYIRERLKLEKGKPHSPAPVILLHIAAVLLVSAASVFGLVPVLPLAVFAYLFWRAAWGLSAKRKKMRAVQMGIREIIYGAVLVLTIVVGFYFGI